VQSGVAHESGRDEDGEGYAMSEQNSERVEAIRGRYVQHKAGPYIVFRDRNLEQLVCWDIPFLLAEIERLSGQAGEDGEVSP
jgi:hypothetical protein